MRGDVQNLENIQDGSFDVIVTRNLTWNLEEPQKAYQEWCRVLKKGGILLNFDAGWYTIFLMTNEECIRRGSQKCRGCRSF